MPHPHLHATQAAIILKEVNPVWFASVQDEKIKELKSYFRNVVKQKKQQWIVLQSMGLGCDSPFDVLTTKEIKQYLCMMSYAHNGNKPQYEKFRNKLKVTMCDILEILTESDNVALTIGEDGESTMTHNEGTVLNYSNKMTTVNDNLEFLEARAEFVNLWEN